ncbi:MAG TPA: hypothetical protein VHN79_07315, partial [Lacunisphaera sp.]|nr:hypothetical protein [Lacunisphaera sp.]
VATVAVAVVTALYLRWSERVDLLGELPAFGWICAASLVNSLVLIPQAHLFTSRRDNLILAVNFAAMLTAVGTSLWLIPRFGVLGAAWSGGMTSAVLLLATTAAALRWREGRA